MIDLRYTKAFSNPFRLDEVCFHDNVNDKETFNCVLWNNISSSMT